MNKILKYGLLGTGVVAGIAGAGITYIALTFNPNDYKPQIIQAVKESKQRNLRLDGDISLSFFPNIGANLSKVSLSEFNSDQEFAAIESARVSLALMPLLRRQVVVNEVSVSGLRATIVKHQDGTSNIDDLLGKAEPQPDDGAKVASQPVKFDIAAVSLEGSNFSYRDEMAGAKYALKNISLKTGRIAEGTPSSIDFSADIDADKPKLDITTQLKATVTFDLANNSWQVNGLEFKVNGVAQDITDLQVQASGDASANLGTQEFAAKQLLVLASGLKDKEKFDVKLDLPALNLSKEEYSSGKASIVAKLDGAMGNLVASLSLPGLEGNAKSFKSNIIVDAELKQPEQAFKARLTTAVQGSPDAGQFDFSGMTLALNATGDKLPNKSVSSEMKGNIQLNTERQSVQANLSGGLLDSKVAAKLAVNGFDRLVVRFDAEVDQFDADLYMPKAVDAETAKVGATTAEASQAAPEQPLDLSALQQLDLEGSVRIGSLKVANVKLAQVKLEMKAHNGLLDVSPLSANLYQGSFSGSVSVNAQQAVPSFNFRQDVNGINLGSLLKDAGGLDTVEGKGSVTLNLTTRGKTLSALKNAVSGKMALNVANAAFRQDGKTYAGEVKGNVQVDGSKQSLQADVSGRLQQSKFAAKVALKDFDDPAIRFDVDVDQLDVDQYLPKEAKGKGKQQSAPEEAFDLSALKKLNAEGGLRIGALKVMNIKLAQVRLDMKASKGMVNVNPLSANLYQGSMNGSISVNAQATPSFTINEKLSNVAIAPLIKDLMDFDAVEGYGNVVLNLTTQGNLVSALKKGLNGDASVNLANGAIKGINLTKLMQNAQNIGKGATTQTLGVSKEEKTEFSEFQASFKVSNGVAHNDDLSVRSPQLRITGGGDIDIGNESLNYTAKAMLQQTQGQDSLMVPVQLSGPFTDLKYKLDYTGMLEDLARRKLEARAQELKNKAVDDAKKRLEDELRKGLKGLFK